MSARLWRVVREGSEQARKGIEERGLEKRRERNVRKFLGQVRDRLEKALTEVIVVRICPSCLVGLERTLDVSVPVTIAPSRLPASCPCCGKESRDCRAVKFSAQSS